MDNSENANDQYLPEHEGDIPGNIDSHTIDKEKDSHVPERVFLASQRNKKRVKIVENQSKLFQEASYAVDTVESKFLEGIGDVRQCISHMEKERLMMEQHISSLQESLRRISSERNQQSNHILLLQQEVEDLKGDLNGHQSDHQKLKKEMNELQSSHDRHLYLIADRHRKTRLAHKTLRRWKGRIRSKEKVCLLEEENSRLKRELLACQEDAKKAFLRSAHKLNSEAISMFQNTARRQIEQSLLPEEQEGNLSRSSASSSVSSTSSASVMDDRRRAAHSYVSEDENRPKRVHEGLDDDNLSNNIMPQYSSEQYRSLYRRNNNAAAAARERKSSEKHEPKLRISSYIPDPLRKETRKLLRGLRSTVEEPERNSDKLGICQKSHVHICHCKCPPERGSDCPYCTPAENRAGNNYNLANMTKEPRKSSSHLTPYNRQREIKNQKSKVTYKPSGSTVVIEKHMN